MSYSCADFENDIEILLTRHNLLPEDADMVAVADSVTVALEQRAALLVALRRLTDAVGALPVSQTNAALALAHCGATEALTKAEKE